MPSPRCTDWRFSTTESFWLQPPYGQTATMKFCPMGSDDSTNAREVPGTAAVHSGFWA